MKPLLVMLAGPNGAGKSTFYEAFLSHLDLPFLNPDVFAGITGLGPYEAAEQVSALREAMVSSGAGFISETVLSDPQGAKVEFLASAARRGFDIQLIYIGLESAALSRARVKRRVEAGGHDVPRDKLRNRFPRTLKNLGRTISVLPRVTIYDNSTFGHPFLFVAEFREQKLAQRRDGKIPPWARRFVR